MSADRVTIALFGGVYSWVARQPGETHRSSPWERWGSWAFLRSPSHIGQVVTCRQPPYRRRRRIWCSR
jgi:hypothetical protein